MIPSYMLTSSIITSLMSATCVLRGASWTAAPSASIIELLKQRVLARSARAPEAQRGQMPAPWGPGRM